MHSPLYYTSKETQFMFYNALFAVKTILPYNGKHTNKNSYIEKLIFDISLCFVKWYLKKESLTINEKGY